MAPELQEVLPKAGLVVSEKGQLTEVLCKPKILPLKSVSLERIEKMEVCSIYQTSHAEVRSTDLCLIAGSRSEAQQHGRSKCHRCIALVVGTSFSGHAYQPCCSQYMKEHSTSESARWLLCIVPGVISTLERSQGIVFD